MMSKARKRLILLSLNIQLSLNNNVSILVVLLDFLTINSLHRSDFNPLCIYLTHDIQTSFFPCPSQLLFNRCYTQ